MEFPLGDHVIHNGNAVLFDYSASRRRRGHPNIGFCYVDAREGSSIVKHKGDQHYVPKALRTKITRKLREKHGRPVIFIEHSSEQGFDNEFFRVVEDNR